jgi:nucleotide-binding universal stress UspA family protein
MKTILVAISGTSSDNSVLDAAYAIAHPLNAHLEFIHIPLSSIGVSDYNRHIEFARGGGLDVALKDTLSNSDDAATKASAHITSFCTSNNILRISAPSCLGMVTASWLTGPTAPSIDGLMRAARTHDLIVVGRSAGKRSWSQGLLENLATESGRPLLVVPPTTEKLTLGRIAIWWKDHHAAARAVTAALPILGAAGEVVVISVLEKEDQTADSAVDMGYQLGWHGIDATAKVLGRDRRPTIDVLWSASLARRVDLVVMGGFSRSRIRESIFGGCTQAVLEAGARPVFLLH